MMQQSKPISADFPFASHDIEIFGSHMNYVDVGHGDPIVFLHGNPTSSYLWRNIIPYLEPHARCIAPDLVGFGKSDKPALEYRVFDHVRYLDEFFDALDLKKFTLVIHDWGSALGFNYARRFPERVKAIAFMEAMIAPMPAIEMFPPEIAEAFRGFRTPGVGWRMIAEENQFIEGVLPGTILRKLAAVEMDHYRAPFATVESRRPIAQFPKDLSFAGEPVDVTWMIKKYNAWLCTAQHPKLLLHARPGVLIRPQEVAWCQAHLPALETVDLGEGLHYLQEDHPHEIGSAIADWYRRLV